MSIKQTERYDKGRSLPWSEVLAQLPFLASVTRACCPPSPGSTTAARISCIFPDRQP